MLETIRLNDNGNEVTISDGDSPISDMGVLENFRESFLISR